MQVKDGNQARSQGLLQLAERGQDGEDIQFGEEANGRDDNSLITQVFCWIHIHLLGELGYKVVDSLSL